MRKSYVIPMKRTRDVDELLRQLRVRCDVYLRDATAQVPSSDPSIVITRKALAEWQDLIDDIDPPYEDAADPRTLVEEVLRTLHRDEFSPALSHPSHRGTGEFLWVFLRRVGWLPHELLYIKISLRGDVFVISIHPEYEP